MVHGQGLKVPDPSSRRPLSTRAIAANKCGGMPCARSAAAIYTSALSATHWKTAIAESAEGAALTGLGNYPEAEKMLVRSYGILSKDKFVPASFLSLTQSYLQTLHEQERHAHRAAPPVAAR